MTNQQEQRISIGKPILVCRWRLSQGVLPLLGRHMKALAARSIMGKPVTPELVGWTKQHIEWTLNPKSEKEKNGVLMLVVDEEGKAAMSIGPYRAIALDAFAGSNDPSESAASSGPGAPTDSSERPISSNPTDPLALSAPHNAPDPSFWTFLIERAQLAQKEAVETGVAPEVFWAVHVDGTRGAPGCSGTEGAQVNAKPQLIIGVPRESVLSGLNSLMFDLAKTKGYQVAFDPDLISHIENELGFAPKQDPQGHKYQKGASSGRAYDEIFLVSDEHGITGNSTGAITSEFAAYYDKLLNATTSC